MMSLNEYKDYLANTYSWSIDNSSELVVAFYSLTNCISHSTTSQGRRCYPHSSEEETEPQKGLK